MPLKVEYLSNNQFDSYVHLTGFFLLEESKKVIYEKWEVIKGTLDCDPQDLAHDGFKYIEPNEDIVSLLPSVGKLI